MDLRCRKWTATLWLAVVSVCPAQAQYTAVTLPLPAGSASAQAYAASEGQQVGVTASGHALLWNNVSGSPIDLNIGQHGSVASSAYRGYQGGSYIAFIYHTVGSGKGGGGSHSYPIPHAVLWHGSASSVVDLNPAGAYKSTLMGVGDGQQVGWTAASYSGPHHASLWSGTAASAVNLEPAGFNPSEALAIDGGQQVGFGSVTATGAVHALLWHGAATGAVDLHPTGFVSTASYAEAVDAATDQQAGYVNLGSASAPLVHACLWNGTAASAMDINPAGVSGSVALAVRGGFQAGYGVTPAGNHHALLWHGSAASALDLHTFLPSNFISSQVNSIDQDGSIIGSASNGISNYPVVWKRNAIPNIVITQDVPPGASGWATQNVTLTFTSPFTTSGGIITYRINGGDAIQVPGNVATLSLSASGAYLVEAYATSGLGQPTPSQLYTVNLDKTPPQTTLRYTNFTLSLAATDTNRLLSNTSDDQALLIRRHIIFNDASSGVASTFYILDGGATLTYTGSLVLANATHTVEYWSTDKAGNVETHHIVTLDAVAPTLTTLSPNTVLSGSPAFTLTLTGAGFLPGSIVQWNGAARATTYLSATLLQVAISASDVATAGTANVTVTNPTPGTGTSTALVFTILQRSIATGGTANIEEAGQGTFDLNPVTGNSGFTLNSATVHVTTNAATTFLDVNGNGMTSAVFFDILLDGQNLKVVGTYDSVSQILTAWTVQMQ